MSDLHRISTSRLMLAPLVVLGIVCLALRTPVYAQEKGDYEAWLRKQQQAYADFQNKQDAAFAKFLAESWRDVDVDVPRPSPLEDKPRSIPSAANADPSAPPDPLTFDNLDNPADDLLADPSPTPPAEDAPDEMGDERAEEMADDAVPTPDPQPDPAPTPDPAPAEPSAPAAALPQQTTASFFGTSLTVAYAAALTPSVNGRPRPEMVQRYWTRIAQGPIGPFLDQTRSDRDRLALDDWGYYRYLTRLSETLYATETDLAQENAAALWVWAMLVKSGYAARIGYNDREIFLMLPSDDLLYDVPQLRIDGQRYYLLNARDRERLGSLRTYTGQHPEATQAMTFNLSQMPRLASDTETRTLSFFYDGTTHTVPVQYNPTVLRYLEDYPKAELRILFQSGMSTEAHTAMLNALRPLVEGRDEVDAVNLLLRFVQKGFEYKVDEDSFGEERFLFPEETLGMPYSDCEDRSVLFAYLVRHLLDLQTVALRYPRHVATGVRLEETTPDDVPGTHLEVDGHTYVMADPTYIDATLGMAMPFVIGETPEIISVQ